MVMQFAHETFCSARRKLSLATPRINVNERLSREMSKVLQLILVAFAASLIASCATNTTVSPARTVRKSNHLQNVRTTAYTRSEKGGHRNAVGMYLSGKNVMSAASDWSRFPFGTRFRLADTKEEYVIDDYGSALIGTGTIDLYKKTKLEVKRWGVRRVDIDILHWGSDVESLKILGPRAKHSSVQRMIAALQKKGTEHAIAQSLD
jgi:3D (Asp-Asp-Asp) domain-containing protein